MTISLLLIQIFFIPVLAPLCIGVIRKIKAYMQNRHGADVFQPYRDIGKLFKKDEVVSEDASSISLIGPYIIFAVMLVVALLVPIVSGLQFFGALGDLIVLIYLIALGTFFMALLGLDAGNAFGGLGSSREMTLAACTEGGLLFSLLPAAIIASSTSFSAMFFGIGALSALQNTALIIAFFAFFIALLAENARYPFDNPSTHLELTMVHEAMIIEASGKRLALLEWASAMKLLAFALIGANVFFPSLPFATEGSMSLLALLFVFGKVLALMIAVAVIESTTPKLRYLRLPDLLFTSFSLGVIALYVALIA
jgi:formate hydrogenlyase subunit 4